jgi:SAM-dependent methyltransferase
MAALLDLSQRIARVQLRDFGCDGVHLFQNNGVEAGQSVGHVHVNVTARYKGEPYSFVASKELAPPTPTDWKEWFGRMRAGLAGNSDAAIRATEPGTKVGSFELFADEYAQHAEGGAYNALYDRPAVLELLGDVRGKSVLDAGCGPGLYAEELLHRGARVTGFDESPRMIELAKARTASDDFRTHDLAKPIDWLPDGAFDLALMALVIHHLDDRVAALKELHRVLKPSGRLVVSTHHPAIDWQRLGGSYFAIQPVQETWRRGRWVVRYWRMPLETVCDEFMQAGFLIEKLVEPRPIAEMAAMAPEDYSKLQSNPGFIAFRLRKAT